MSRKRSTATELNAGFVIVLGSILTFAGAGIVHGLFVMVWP